MSYPIETSRRHRAAGQPGGFTLVELMVSVTIMSLIAGATYACFHAGSRAWRKARDRSDASQQARVVLRMMARDLRGAFRPPRGASTFMGVDRVRDDRSADAVDFVAVAAGPARPAAPHSDRCEIGYYLDLDPATDAEGLVRRIDRTPDDDDLEGGVLEEIGPAVQELNLEYHDGVGWYDAWDEDDGVPFQVRITIGIVETDGDERLRVLSTVVHLPMGGFGFGELDEGELVPTEEAGDTEKKEE